jgi:RPA family protein
VGHHDESIIIVKPELVATIDTENLEVWVNDPNCENAAEIQAEINRRAEAKKLALLANPFDPRTEISADGRVIRTTIWIVGFVIPAIVGIFIALFRL